MRVPPSYRNSQAGQPELLEKARKSWENREKFKLPHRLSRAVLFEKNTPLGGKSRKPGAQRMVGPPA
jgi:hypothetical protein